MSRTLLERILAKTPNAPADNGSGGSTQFRDLLELARARLDVARRRSRRRTADAHDEWRDRAYEAVGRFVVRNSDIIISIWNGELAPGAGGRSRSSNTPTRSASRSGGSMRRKIPSRLGSPNLRHSQPVTYTDGDGDDLHAYLNRQILGPSPSRANRQTLSPASRAWGNPRPSIPRKIILTRSQIDRGVGLGSITK